ncbi:HSP20-like chaperone [Parathielavia hyrcaniae]|uniref:HSP20-like chaperone n=1 Tax=Parathielavia hyrcaniae TaxID=113614 RepID=A0AAN6T543_9PEZI|nr:HSP20-like chaperone [Parathielavia hyrcaniae]
MLEGIIALTRGYKHQDPFLNAHSPEHLTMQASRSLISRAITSTLRLRQPSLASRRTIIPTQRRNMSLFHPFSHHSHTTPGAPSALGFSSLFRMLDEFDRYANQQLGSGLAGTSVTSFSPKFDVAEHENEYVLQGELPGMAPEKVEIEFTDEQTLVVRGRSERKHTEGDPALLEAPRETKRIEDAEGSTNGNGNQVSEQSKPAASEEGAKSKPRYWLSERSYGEFSRVFTFPAPVDQDNVRAKFKDGILDVTVPKAAKKSGKRITIQ